MGIFDGLERLINEHGSAVILKERIDLAKDKYASLERKVAELSEENSRLRAQNAELLAKRFDAAETPAIEIDDVGVRILQFLATRGDLEVGHIAHQLGIDREVAAFHVEEMESADFISGSYAMMREPSYSLAQEGRRFLIKNGHFKT
jgi:hypothetical protein